MLTRHRLRPSASRRRKIANEKQLCHLRDLAHRAGIEPPRVVWASDAKDAIRRLEQHLAHLRQPTLEGM